MCGYFCIGFIGFMLKRKTLTEYTNPFLPNNFKKNNDIILNYFMSNVKRCTILIKHQVFIQIYQMNNKLD